MSKATHHLVLCPEVFPKTLNPLEVADDHTAGVAQNVGDNENPIVSLGKCEVGFGRRRAVRAFRNHGALRLCGDFRVDHALDGTGYQDVAAPRQQLHGVDRRLIRAAFQSTMFGDVLDRRLNLEALRIVESGRVIADSNDLDALAHETQRGVRANIAKALNDRCRIAGVDLQGFERGRGRNAMP